MTATFIERLKSLRASRHLSQRELADQAGLARSSISMYECGAREPNREALEALSDFFNVDIDYLLGRSNKTTILDPEQYFAQEMYYNEGVMMRQFGELSEEKKQLVRELVKNLRGGEA